MKSTGSFAYIEEDCGKLAKGFKYKNTEVLRCEIEYPIFAPKNFSASRINRWYMLRALSYANSVKSRFYGEAAKQRDMFDGKTGFESLNINVSYGAMYMQNGIISVFLDTSEQLRYSGSHLYRVSQTWLVNSVARVPAGYFFKPGSLWGRAVVDEIARTIDKEDAEKTGAFYSDAKKRAKRHLNAENYYLADDGFVFYFQ